jgi:hypothetical protein
MFLPRNGEDAGRVGVIVSHKHKFIFIKTRKTAGTSIELFFSRFCGERDVITPIYPAVPDAEYHVPRNWRGLYNPLPDISDALRAGEGTSRKYEVWKMTKRFLRGMRFYNHIPASRARRRLPKTIWEDYFTFCFERNPWDRMISHYYWYTRDTQLTFGEFLSTPRHQLNHPLYTDRSGEEVIVDHVARYEDLNGEMAAICERVGIPFDGDLGIRAKGATRKDRAPYQEFFQGENERFIEMIEELCQREIQLLGYSFEADG